MMKTIKPNEPDSGKARLKPMPEKKTRFFDRFSRNLALGGMLVLTIAAVRNAQLPTGQTVLAAIQEVVDPQWKDGLGKISFVSHLLPESVAVFFESAPDARLTAPCLGKVTHPWTEKEPYVGYLPNDRNVYAAAAGQVMSVAHGLRDEQIVRVRHENGIETLYYNLESVLVKEGDSVTEKTCLGQRLPAEEALMETRRAGRPIDPGAMLRYREEQP